MRGKDLPNKGYFVNNLGQFLTQQFSKRHTKPIWIELYRTVFRVYAYAYCCRDAKLRLGGIKAFQVVKELKEVWVQVYKRMIKTNTGTLVL